MGQRRSLAAVLLALTLAAGCSGDGDGALDRQAGSARSSTTSTAAPVARPRGGTAKVAVWGEPDPAAATLGGAAARALVLPQLHVAQPDGSWAPSLVEAGSEREGRDLRSVSFRLRAGASWSDGRPITASDLRRSADRRFVSTVEGPGRDGRIRVRFTQRLPGWRRLWSGVDAVSAPAAGVWGGPFVVASRVAGLELVLRRNPRWWGGPGPFLDEVRLVLVPDLVTGAELLERGEVDAWMPMAATVRTDELRAMRGVRIDAVEPGGWWVGLLLNSSELDPERRRGLVATVDRRGFVGAFLKGEASVLNGFVAAEQRVWAGIRPGDPSGLGDDSVDLVGTVEEPMTALLQRSMQKRAQPSGAMLELRTAESDIVEPWVAQGEYDAAVVVAVDPPTPCWTCRWAGVDERLARAADAGDGGAVLELERRLRDDALVLPLWRPRTVVAWRGSLRGLRANGYALSAAWNAAEWWRER